jgi:hypothetical protein
LVIQRKTQTEEFWRDEFVITSDDVAQLYDSILEDAHPVAQQELGQSLVDRYCRQEEAKIQGELSRAPAYQPRDAHEPGQELIFPALDYALGTVVDTRSAHNPEFGEFTAIQVRFEGREKLREFASALEGDHKLNRKEGDSGLLSTEQLPDTGELYDRFGQIVEEKLEAALRASEEFIRVEDAWFLRELLVEIHPGQLNIAEALVEIKSMPLTTASLLPDLDLPAEVPEEIRLLSLNRALESDERFDNVGDVGREVWYLRRLTPGPVVTQPPRLVLDEETYPREALTRELLAIEREIEDEGTGDEVLGPSQPIYRATIALPYPHWRSGTLPLTARTRGLFPKAGTRHSPIVLVDGQTGDKLQGWVVHKHSYVCGLENWYERHKLPAGALLKLERTRDPRVIAVEYTPQRLKGLWVKVAAVQGGQLVFQMRKIPIACEFDEQLALGEDSPSEIDSLWTRWRGRSLQQTMVQIMPELVKLTPQGTVHAKTVYSAVNVLKRATPGAVFALLADEPCFVSMGGGYWAFDEALVR